MPEAAGRPRPADVFFPAEEYRARLMAVREAMRARDLDALLVASPENIYYLVGLSHQGYFAFTLLILRADGAPLLVTRSMERVTLSAQTPDVEHVGFADDEPPADAAVGAVRAAGLASRRIGVEKSTMYFPVRVWEALLQDLPDARWEDGSGLVDELRLVKSPAEIAYTRQAAALSDRAVRAGIATAGVGVNEREVAAEVYRALVTGGSEYPGMAPLVRSTETLLHEHSTWRDRVLTPGDALFIELSASVRRYHAPLTRLVHVGHAPEGVGAAAQIVLAGLEAIRSALRPGAVTGDVYASWQAVVDQALGHPNYRRHHCGYTIGIGFPPSWVGGSAVVGIRPGSTITVREGMVFHVLSWLLGVEPGDYGVSDTLLVMTAGGQLLTSTSRAPMVIA